MLPQVERLALQRWAKATCQLDPDTGGPINQGDLARRLGFSQPAIGKLVNHAEVGPGIRDGVLAHLKMTRDQFLAEWGRAEDVKEEGWRATAEAAGYDPEDPVVAEEFQNAYQGVLESLPMLAGRGIARRRAEAKGKGAVDNRFTGEDVATGKSAEASGFVPAGKSTSGKAGKGRGK